MPDACYGLPGDVLEYEAAYELSSAADLSIASPSVWTKPCALLADACESRDKVPKVLRVFIDAYRLAEPVPRVVEAAYLLGRN